MVASRVRAPLLGLARCLHWLVEFPARSKERLGGRIDDGIYASMRMRLVRSVADDAQGVTVAPSSDAGDGVGRTRSAVVMERRPARERGRGQRQWRARAVTGNAGAMFAWLRMARCVVGKLHSGRWGGGIGLMLLRCDIAYGRA